MILRWLRWRREARAAEMRRRNAAYRRHRQLSRLVNGGAYDDPDGVRRVEEPWMACTPYHEPLSVLRQRVCQRMADRALMWKTRARDPLLKKLYERLERRWLTRAGWDYSGSIPPSWSHP